MRDHDNPYAAALDGLVLADPVAAFFDFCRERESIRQRRESGAPPPWSADPIFQQGRFLNVFREDDRVSRSILRFAAPVADDLPALVQALFFARWCNRSSTLDALSVELLQDPEQLRLLLETLPQQPWCNVTAYPVEPVRWQGLFHSRFDAATRLFAETAESLTQLIVAAGGDVVRATRAVNERLGMQNDFPIFMAVIDMAWFRPAVIDPGSDVPTGIGAAPFLDLLQRHLGLADHQQTCRRMIALQAERWPEARRPLQPIDVEYLACECRKYYSYVNGTKTFEGKNAFRPGEPAQLEFDLPDETPSTPAVQTRIQVIAGGPCSGKTTVIEALEQAGYRVERETSRRLLEAGGAEGQTAEALRADPARWQQHILRQDHALFDGLPIDELVFADTSFIEDLVFAARAGVVVGPNTEAWLRRKRYGKVFFLEPLEGYEQTSVRLESRQVAKQISDQVRACYEAHGYQLEIVPAGTLAERVELILARADPKD